MSKQPCGTSDSRAEYRSSLGHHVILVGSEHWQRINFTPGLPLCHSKEPRGDEAAGFLSLTHRLSTVSSSNKHLHCISHPSTGQILPCPLTVKHSGVVGVVVVGAAG